MLKNIPKILSPQLLKVLCEMGHGDELVIADGTFPRRAWERTPLSSVRTACPRQSFWTLF